MSSILQDCKHAVRSLARSPGFTVMVVLTLALGIGANTTIFSAVYAVLLRPLPFGEPEKIIQLFVVFPEGSGTAFSPPDFNDLAQRNRTLSALTAVNAGSMALTGDGPAEQIPSAAVTGRFFDVFGTGARRGRALDEDDATLGAPPVAVISHSLWLRRFAGDSAAIGRAIRLDGTTYELVGIMPPEFSYPLGAELWTPLAFTSDDLTTQRGAQYLEVFGRMKPNISVDAAAADLAMVAGQLRQDYPRTNANKSATARSLHSALTGDVQRAILMLMVAVGLVLLIACVNVANLLLVRGFGRSREIAVRAALGATPFRLVRLQLTECALLAVAGGATGLLIAAWGSELIAAASATGVPLLDRSRIDAAAVAFAIALSLITTAVFGALPSWHAARPTMLGRQLRTNSAGSVGDRGRSRLRRVLVVGELALATTLLVGAGLLARSLMKLGAVDLGFDPAGSFTFGIDMNGPRYSTPQARAQFMDQLLNDLRGLPGVRSAGAVFHTPFTGFGYAISGYEIDGRLLSGAEPSRTTVQVRVATPQYVEAMRIGVAAGRTFEAGDRNGTQPVMLVSESAAKLLWPNEPALGRSFTIGTRLGRSRESPRAGGTVVGVVADVREASPNLAPLPTIYLPHAQYPMGYMGIVMRSDGNPALLSEPARRVLARLDRDMPMFRARTMQELVGTAVSQPRFYVALLGTFACVAILLAAVGVFGVVSQGVAQRTRELGVRIALGAQRREILRMILSDAGLLAIPGVALGLLGAAAATQALRKLLFEVEPVDPGTYAVVGITLVAAALLASSLPASRAARINPMGALRSE